MRPPAEPLGGGAADREPSQAVAVQFSRDLNWLVPLLLSVGIAIALTAGVLGHLSTALIGAPPDQQQCVWTLGWFAFALTHWLDPLVTTYVTAGGQPINLMQNTATPLYGLLFSPVTLTAGPVAAYNLAMVASLAGSAWVSMLVLSRYVRHRPAAWVAGALFAFSPFALGEATAGHLNWSALWPLPLTLLLLDELVARQRHSPVAIGAALGLLGAAELLVNEEELASSAFVALIVLAVLAATHRGQLRPRLRYVRLGFGSAAAVFAALAGAPLAVEFFGPGRPAHGLVQDAFSYSDYSARVLGFLLPTPSQDLAPGAVANIGQRLLPYAINPGEGGVYIGVPVLLGVAWAHWRLRSEPWVRVGALVAAVGLVLALGPFALVERLPLIGQATPARFVLIAWLGLALVIAIMLDRTWDRQASYARAVTVALGAAMVVSLLPSSVLQVQHVPIPAALTDSTLSAGQLVAVLPAPTLPVQDAEVMVWQAASGFRYRLPWGYLLQPGLGGALALAPSSLTATTVAAIAAGVTAPPGAARRVSSQLRHWGVHTVAVGPMPRQWQVVRFLTRALGRAPQWVGSVAIWGPSGAEWTHKNPGW
jgi:hypothetical protein